MQEEFDEIIAELNDWQKELSPYYEDGIRYDMIERFKDLLEEHMEWGN